MRLFSHYAYRTLSNSYLVGPDQPGDALLIDPSTFDTSLLTLVESHGYYVRAVLLTHCDESHFDGLRVVQRIYNCTVYSALPTFLDTPNHRVVHDDQLDVFGEPVRVIGLPGHGRDAMAYSIGGFLFTGAAMTAGESGLVHTSSAGSVLLARIRERVLTLPDWTVVLPFWGPPSTVGLERLTFAQGSPDQPEQRR